MRQGEMQLTTAEPVAKTTHLGRDYQLRRADNGQWGVWRLGGRYGQTPQSEWVCIWWVPGWASERCLDDALTLTQMFELFGPGSPVPAEVMRVFAVAGARQ